MEIINTYKQNIPAIRFIGKRYNDEDRVNGGFGHAWQAWLQNNWCEPIFVAAGGSEACRQLYEDGSAMLGFMRHKEGEPFQYWIGRFTPPQTVVPDGYSYIDIDASNCGICWYEGQEPDIYGKEHLALEKFAERNWRIQSDGQGAIWFFERYSEERFVPKGENQTYILDIGFYIE